MDYASKYLTKLITNFIIFLFLASVVNADELIPYEVAIENRMTNQDLLIKFYPVGTLFNGDISTSQYSLKKRLTVDILRRGQINPDDKLRYITGLDGISLNGLSGPEIGFFHLYCQGCQVPEPYLSRGFNRYCYLGHDATANGIGLDGIFGYGRYMLEIYNTANPPTRLIQIPIDWGHFLYPNTPGAGNDLLIFINSISPLNITYQWAAILQPSACGSQSGWEISLFDQSIPLEDRGNFKVFKQYHCKDDGLVWRGYFPASPDFGNSSSEISSLSYPLNATSLTGGYASPDHVNPGSLFRRLQISSTNHAYIRSGQTFTVESGITSPPTLNQLLVNNNGSFTVSTSSTLSIRPNAEVRVRPGGQFCNYGTVTGGTVIFEGGGRSKCVAWDGIFNGATVVLEYSAVVEIAENTTWTFDSGATLIMKSGSQFKFGTNSKLEFLNGSRIFADHASFLPLNADSTWLGFYLEGISQDTIKNCTIENAAGGVNILNKYAGGIAPYSAEISNCIFRNTTTTELNNAVHISNSNNVLIRNCTISSTQLVNGFANGISMDYCPAGVIDILDNTINNCDRGISVTQSSPYIARNTITGASTGGAGLYLDNANGIIKYNTILNFAYSLYSLYSSPYLLKNTFRNAYERNIDLHANSIPVMRPLNSGTTLSWVAGDNHTPGSPSTSLLSFDGDSYPLMDSGYNRVEPGNNSDYMTGDVPGSQPNGINAIYNWWGTLTPDPNKFNVSGGSVIYQPIYKNDGLPGTDYFTLSDIWFGELFDTTYVEDLGDTPGPSSLFMQAYRSEVLGQFLTAITLYRSVISTYRNSPYASLSLSRIVNCAEKTRYASGDYAVLQTYLNAIRTNTLYSREMRELAEDFIIKTKVRRGMLNEAINDYQAIYLLNQNNPKGVHALRNKFALIAMRDGQGHTSPFSGIPNNQNTLTAELPSVFKLYQNYPNPFNPVTTIKYNIPKDGNVSLKVYDILGREVYSMNEFKKAGSNEVKFSGENLASGLYYYRLETNGIVETKKMIVIK